MYLISKSRPQQPHINTSTPTYSPRSQTGSSKTNKSENNRLDWLHEELMALKLRCDQNPYSSSGRHSDKKRKEPRGEYRRLEEIHTSMQQQLEKDRQEIDQERQKMEADRRQFNAERHKHARDVQRLREELEREIRVQRLQREEIEMWRGGMVVERARHQEEIERLEAEQARLIDDIARLRGDFAWLQAQRESRELEEREEMEEMVRAQAERQAQLQKQKQKQRLQEQYREHIQQRREGERAFRADVFSYESAISDAEAQRQLDESLLQSELLRLMLEQDEQRRVLETANEEAARRIADQMQKEDEQWSLLDTVNQTTDWLIAEAMQIEEENAEAERQRLERRRYCAACMEDEDNLDMVQLPCRHWYCLETLKSAFQHALQERRPFQCCGRNVSIALLADPPPDLLGNYNLLVLERDTPNPLYCANVRCGTFIPPAQFQGAERAVCRTCESTTCQTCRNQAHAGPCPEDVMMQQTRTLADSNGWKACHSCKNMVEKSSGCNHMTCRCGGEFCYVCGQEWKSCAHGV